MTKDDRFPSVEELRRKLGDEPPMSAPVFVPRLRYVAYASAVSILLWVAIVAACVKMVPHL